MKKVVLYTLAILITVSYLYLREDKDKDILSFENYVTELHEIYNDDKKQILDKINNEISNNKNSKKYIGMNLLSRQYCFYLWIDNENLIKYADETETYLRKYNMENELLDFYSMMSSRYIGSRMYNIGYIYIDRGENVAKNIYEKNNSKEMLSTLIAIKYLKAVIALDIGMEIEAETVFKEAEELRTKGIRERVDIYTNILLYYQNKEEYQSVEEYAIRLMKLIEDKYGGEETYKRDNIRAKIILAENYIYTGEIEESIELTNELTDELNNKESGYKYDMYLDEMYFLYSQIYKYYGKSEETVAYLKMAYNIIKDTELKSQKIKIIDSIIEQLEAINDKEELLYWYKIESEILKTAYSSIETQHILSELINTDLSNANYSIKMLKLEKSKITYIVITLIIIVIVIIIIIIKELKRKKLLKENISILEKNIIINNKYYENIKTNNENIKRIKHDIKNHIIVINKLMLEKEYEQVVNYIKHIEDEIDSKSIEIITNNKIIDAIISSKVDSCKSEEIDLDLDIKIPDKIGIDDFDICVIYGNLLDNAIEACRKINEDKVNKYIKLKSIIKGDYLYINIKNNYVDNVNIKYGNFITNKNDKINHGIGIKNIKNSIKKYDGYMKINYDDKEFQVSIIININDKLQ